MTYPPTMGGISGVVRAGTVLFVALACLVHLVAPNNVLFDGSYLAILVASAALAWVGAQRNDGESLVPRLVAAGLTAFAIGDLMWFAQAWTGSDPSFSVSDGPWVLSYILLAVALWVTLMRARGRGQADLDGVIDALTIVTVCVVVLWTFSVEAIVADDLVVRARAGGLGGYPIADAMLLALVIRILADRRTRSGVDAWFGVGVILCWLASDLGYLMFPLTSTVETWTDVGWMVGAALMARSAWQPTAHVAPPAPATTGSSIIRQARHRDPPAGRATDPRRRAAPAGPPQPDRSPHGGHGDPARAGLHPHGPPAALRERGPPRARPRPRRGAGGVAGEVGVPRHHEPRDPHAR